MRPAALHYGRAVSGGGAARVASIPAVDLDFGSLQQLQEAQAQWHREQQQQTQQRQQPFQRSNLRPKNPVKEKQEMQREERRLRWGALYKLTNPVTTHSA